jgi:hypothetical protein
LISKYLKYRCERKKTLRIRELDAWCRQNVVGLWASIMENHEIIAYLFTREEDAVMFKMVFG